MICHDDHRLTARRQYAEARPSDVRTLELTHRLDIHAVVKSAQAREPRFRSIHSPPMCSSCAAPANAVEIGICDADVIPTTPDVATNAAGAKVAQDRFCITPHRQLASSR